MTPGQIIDVGLRYCHLCLGTARMYLFKTDVPGAKATNLFVCQTCDRPRRPGD